VTSEVPSQKFVNKDPNLVPKFPPFYFKYQDPITQQLKFFYPEILHEFSPDLNEWEWKTLNSYRRYTEDGMEYFYNLSGPDPNKFSCRVTNL
jgi:hypothetical protein